MLTLDPRTKSGSTRNESDRLYLREATISCELWLYLELWVSSSTSIPSKMGWLLLVCFNISWRISFFRLSFGIFSLSLVTGFVTYTIQKYKIFKVPGYRKLSAFLNSSGYIKHWSHVRTNDKMEFDSDSEFRFFRLLSPQATASFFFP
jgi:hypothetical protein